MSEDKRTVHTDALETLGMIIDENQKRDAIHLAVEPMVSKYCMAPGQHLTANGEMCGEYDDNAVGIVDPFLKEAVKPGEYFWLVLYPRTIKSLRHVWEHPSFPQSEINVDDESVASSKKWIEDYANSFPQGMYGEYVSYWCLINGAKEFLYSNDYLNKGDIFDGKRLNQEFWHHYEIVTGEKVDENKKQNFFTCSC